MGLVDGAMMILLAVAIIAVVQTVLSPLGPEQSPAEQPSPVLSRLRRVMSQFALVGSRRTNQRATTPQTSL